MEGELESAAKELKLLASRQFISPAELERAKVLMVQLKAAGMTNTEISNLVDDRWSQSTIKGYTRGVLPSGSPSWQGMVTLFSELLSRELSIKDVEETIRLKKQLEQQKSSITELASFVTEIQAQGIGVAAFAELYWDWIGAGLKALDVASALKLKGELEGIGLNLDSLTKIASLAGKLGNADGILDALTKYGDITEVERQRANIQAETEREKKAAKDTLDQLGTEVAAKQRTLQGLQGNLSEAKEALAAYRSLASKGFDLAALEQLAQAATKYGSPSQLLEAVNRFDSLGDIEAKANEADRNLKKREAALKSLESSYSHLGSAIEMCKKLMSQYHLGSEGIGTIFSATEKYGQPIQVLKAIEAYGKLQTMEEKLRQQELKVASTEAKIKTLEKGEVEVKAKIEAALNLLETLNARALEVGRVIGNEEERMRRGRRFRSILTLLEDPTKASYEDNAPHVLALANVIVAFVRAHNDKFVRPFGISQGLEYLMEDLGNVRNKG